MAFTTTIQTPIYWQIPTLTAKSQQHWLPWGKGCVINDVSHRWGPISACGGGGTGWSSKWRNPMVPEPLPDESTYYRYGALGRNCTDVFTVPIVTTYAAHSNAAVSVALSVDDPLLEIGLTVAPSGMSYRRELLRLGQGRDVEFTAHIVGHAADWRPALQFMVDEFADYFVSPIDPDKLTDYEGLGAYTWTGAGGTKPYNATRAKAIGFKTNWDLSGTFMPYDGMFLPYTEKWLNLGPINSGLAQYNVTFNMINNYYKQIQSEGFHSLSYFDIGNWGTSVTTHPRGCSTEVGCGTRANGDPAPCATPNGGNCYLVQKLMDALLHHGWTITGGRFMVHHNDWVGTTDMDTMEPCFEDMLIEQAERHILKLGPQFEGIAIDRLDYSEAFNYDRDDNISWVPVSPGRKANPAGNWPHNVIANWTWGPARALRLSYRHTYERLHQTLHGKNGEIGKLIMNNCNAEGNVCRIDLLKYFDGTFSEGSALTPAAWAGLRTPTIVWTYKLSDDLVLLHAYFQQHLLMDAYPLAPMPLNDHSIQPGSQIVEQAYLDYAPMFDAMHGAKWLLSSRPVSVKSFGRDASAANTSDAPGFNIFTVAAAGAADQQPGANPAALPAALLVPVMLANATTVSSVVLTINLTSTVAELGWPATTSLGAVSALHPAGAWAVIGPAKRVGACFEITVPLKDGCALVRAVPT